MMEGSLDGRALANFSYLSALSFFTDIDKLGMVVVDNERVQVDSEFSEDWVFIRVFLNNMLDK